MAFKTFQQLTTASTVQDADLFATARGTGALTSVTGTVLVTYLATKFALLTNNLSDLPSASTARTNLGLGTSATHASTDFAASATTVTGGGLVTGGGALSGNLVLTVTAAAGADVQAGTSTTKANTPKAIADAAAFGALTYSSTPTWDVPTNGFNATITLAGNPTIGQVTGVYDGLPLALEVVQDVTGSRVPSFNATYHDFGAAGTPAFQTAANKRDLLVGIYRSVTGKIHWNFRRGA